MLAFTLELLNVFLLFKRVLGYKFREKPWSIIIGVALILFHYVAFIVFPEQILIKLYFLWIAIPVLVIPFIFQGRVLVSLGVGLSLRMVFSILNSTILGVSIIAVEGKVENIINNQVYNIGLTICVIGLVGITIVFRKKRDTIRLYLEKTNPIYFVAFIISCIILLYNPWYFGKVPEEIAQTTQGMNLIKSGALAFIFIVVFILIHTIASQRKELKRMLILNERCIQEQTEQYRLLSQSDKSLRKFRHDYNEHVAVLHSLAQTGEAEALLNYVEQLGAIKDGLKLIFTNNIICDAIINRYDRICRDENIRLLVNGKFPDCVSISETALCVLISNGIKNAYEAVQKCSDNREIQFDVRNTENYVFISIENPITEPPRSENGVLATTKSDISNHGYGTQNMLETARKASGDVTWKIGDNGQIITEIMLNV